MFKKIQKIYRIKKNRFMFDVKERLILILGFFLTQCFGFVYKVKTDAWIEGPLDFFEPYVDYPITKKDNKTWVALSYADKSLKEAEKTIRAIKKHPQVKSTSVSYTIYLLRYANTEWFSEDGPIF